MIRFSRLFALLVLPCIASAQSVQSANVTMATQNSSAPSARRVTLTLSGVTVEEAIRAIAQQAELRPAYSAGTIPGKTVSVNVNNEPVGEVLRNVLTGTGLIAKIGNSNILTIVPQNAKRQGQGVITGKVMDGKSGKGIAGANISVNNDTRGTVSAEDGSYRLVGIAAGTHTVNVRLVGYAKQTKSVNVGDGTTVIADFRLEPSASVLNQVVVTGTVVASELRSVPNAITVITAKQIEERGVASIDQLFRGDIPGLFALNQGSGAPLDEVSMFSRGATALTELSAGTSRGTNPIKTYIDGIEMSDSKYLSQIDPRSIERIEILTGPQASTIYGSNALNGVMQIFTKRGSSSRPQLIIGMQTGWIQNNFSNALTPQHDYSSQLNGVDGHLSYSMGGSWNHTGPWSPAKQTSRINGFGGSRFELFTAAGGMTVDIGIRRAVTGNKRRGGAEQGSTTFFEQGWYSPSASGVNGLASTQTSVLNGQTIGLTLGYTPVQWWSHELVLGLDASNSERIVSARGYTTRTDTTLNLSRNNTSKRSLRYVTNTRVPVASFVRASLSLGIDGWQSLTTSSLVEPQSLTGTLAGFTEVTREPSHNSGGFMQTQLELMDQLFLIYGFRAEWNPNFGDDAQPNYAPRYGLAYTRDIGLVTAKIRGAYGRSTRPPSRSFKAGQTAIQAFGSSSAATITSEYGIPDFYYYRPNVFLRPEYQQGGEGGVELYFDTRGSLIVTRYNQTVDGLISAPQVDTLRSLAPNPTFAFSSDIQGYGYIPQWQYLNVASIRNSGWEMQGSMTTGPLVTRGSYSWTKSRSLGVNPIYSSSFANDSRYKAGASFLHLPEHIWALGVTYSKAKTTLSVNINGTGQLTRTSDEIFNQFLSNRVRLAENRFRINTPTYTSSGGHYTTADFVATHRVSASFEGSLQVRNLGDVYEADNSASFATAGRQTKIGLRVRM